ncbi:MAG: energy-coupling factor ABC transporter ATP-binding protein [Treponema sp.]|nr:energy-coupling factor ABC transporter ATP-binding protein [Treponema sp.]
MENIDFTVPEGSITVLTGKSGCGKSTLAYILAGLYPENGGILESGSVAYRDNSGSVDIHSLTPDKRVAYVSMMFQNCDIQFCMNNLENELLFCLENIGSPPDDAAGIIDRAADRLGIRHLLRRNFNEMSGGEKQKCALCCIVALRSRCVILDEAFANIDTQSAREILAVIKNLGATVLAIDHNTALWDGVCDRVVSLDGVIMERDRASSVAAAESRAPSHAPNRDCNQPRDIVVTARGVTAGGISYPDMLFEKGTLTALLGPSGCGKTTFFTTLIKQRAYKGAIDFFGRKLSALGKQYVFSKCGIVFQNPSSQFLALTVYDEILYSVKRWHKRESKAEQEERALRLLRVFDLEGYKKYSPYLLSQGQQRRLAVLAMLAGEQELLLLDEPTYGQDYENIRAIMELLVEKAKSGLTVIFSTHNETVARDFSHKIIRLGGGGNRDNGGASNE